MRVGIIGAGFMGNMHAACYHNISEVEISVADLDSARAKSLAEKYNANLVQSPDELIADPEIRLVDICLPTYLHREYVVQTAQAGKHVLCEKPIALTIDDAETMIAATRSARVKFMVAHVIRFWPEYLKLKEVYESKELGNILSLTMIRLGAYPSWSKWLSDVNRSGGALFDMHIHDVDFILYLFGEPKAVISQGSPDHVVSLFRYSQLEPVVIEGGFLPAESFTFRMGFRAAFEKGVVDFDSTNSPSLLVLRKGETKSEPWEFKPPTAFEINAGGNISSIYPYLSEIRYFINCVKNDKEPEISTGESAKRSLKVVLAERRSLRTGEIIKLF